MLFVLVICLLSLEASSLVEPPPASIELNDKYVLVDYRNITVRFANFSYQSTLSTGRSFSAFVAVLPSGIATNFSFQLPTGGNESIVYICTTFCRLW